MRAPNWAMPKSRICGSGTHSPCASTKTFRILLRWVFCSVDLSVTSRNLQANRSACEGLHCCTPNETLSETVYFFLGYMRITQISAYSTGSKLSRYVLV
jgi:hypothetical protein